MASSEPDDDTENLTCWICHSDQFDDPTHGPMIQPCACRGSQRLCHRGCIEAWLRARAGADPGRAAGGAASTPLWLQAGKYIHQFSYFDHEQMLPAGLAPPRPAAGVDDAANTAAALSCPLCGERYGVRRKVRACRSGRAGRAPTLHRRRRRRRPPAFALIRRVRALARVSDAAPRSPVDKKRCLAPQGLSELNAQQWQQIIVSLGGALLSFCFLLPRLYIKARARHRRRRPQRADDASQNTARDERAKGVRRCANAERDRPLRFSNQHCRSSATPTARSPCSAAGVNDEGVRAPALLLICARVVARDRRR